MRRPLVSLFLWFSFGCLLVWYGWSKPVVTIILTLIVAGGAAVLLWAVDRQRLAAFTLGIAALLGGMAVMGAELSRPEPLLELAGEQVVLRATVVRESRQEHGRSLLVRPEGGGSRRRVWVFVDLGEAEPQEPWEGRELQVTGTVSLPDTPRNPGGFDQRQYLRTMGVQAVVEAKREGIIALNDSSDPSARMRWTLEQRWKPLMGERSCGGLMSLLFGSTETMEDETLDAFRRIGLGHLLAVSGLHVGVVYGMVQKLLGDRKTSPAVQLLCSAAAMAYAAFAGFSPSASRAALMIVIHGLGRTMQRPYDMATSASLAGMMILIRQPCQVLNGGFQLSLLAAFGLACVLPRISYELEVLADRKRSRVLRMAAEQGSPLLAIPLVMGPICTRRFHWVSLWGFAVNPLAIAAAGLLIPMGMASALLILLGGWFPVLNPAACLLARLSGSFMAGLMNLGEIAARLPGTFPAAGLPPGALALYYAGLFTWCSEPFVLLLRRGKRMTVAAWMIAMVIACSILPYGAGLVPSPGLFVYPGGPAVFLDVGQGDCFHLRTPGGKNILIDGGGSVYKNVGKETLLPYLLHCGVRSVDLALATHLHADHFQGLAELAETMPVKELGIYEANRYGERDSFRRFGRVTYLSAGQRIRIEPGIFIDVLAPPGGSEEEYRAMLADESDENDACLVFLVHYLGLDILITGDLGMEGEAMLLQNGEQRPSAHIIKIGHHGSASSTSEEFLNTVSPQAAVISVGKNYFGHPSERVIELLQKNGIMIGRTDRHGALIVRRIAGGRAEVINGNGEVQWHIDLGQKQ